MKTVAIACQLLLIAGILFIAFSSWSYTLGAWFARRRLPLTPEIGERTPFRWGLIDLLVNVLLYASLSYLAIRVLLLTGLMPYPNDAKVVQAAPVIRPIQFLALGGAQLLVVAAGTLFVCLRARVSLANAGWDLRRWATDFPLSIYGFGIVIVPVFIVQAILTQFIKYEHPAVTPFRESKDWMFFAAASFSAVLVAPIAEEYFFRGILQAWLERLSVVGARTLQDFFAPGPEAPFARSPYQIPPFIQAAEGEASSNGGFDATHSYAAAAAFVAALDSTPPAEMAAKATEEPLPKIDTHWPIFVTSAIFALLHAGQGPAPIPLFLFSVALGYVFRKTGRLLPVILMHMTLNGASMCILALSIILQPK